MSGGMRPRLRTSAHEEHTFKMRDVRSARVKRGSDAVACVTPVLNMHQLQSRCKRNSSIE